MQLRSFASNFNIVYYLVSTYEERNAPKEAKFRWDPVKKQWWTNDEEKARKFIDVADEITYKRLSEIEEKRRASLLDSVKTSTVFSPPSPEGLEYMPFQKAGIEFISQRKNTLLADDMGVGKTIQSIGIINYDNSLNKLLIICPASVKINWKRELGLWLTRSLSINVITSKSKELGDSDITIINYDILEKYKNAILTCRYDMLIVDESHYLKCHEKKKVRNPQTDKQYYVYKTARVQHVFDISKVCGRLLFLTGTPILNKPKEIFTTIKLLEANDFPSTFFDFAKLYCNAHQKVVNRKTGLKVWDFDGSSNLDELQKKLRSTIMIRRRKKDILTELPPKRRQVIELELNGNQDIINEEMKWLTDIRDRREMLKLESLSALADNDESRYDEAIKNLTAIDSVMFSEMAEIRHKTSLAKLPQVISFIRDAMESNDKILVFAYHRDVIENIMDALNEKGVIAVKLYGGMSENAKQKSIDDFWNNPAVKFFIGQITAAGVGLNLQNACTEIFAELDWVPGNISQCEDRAHRKGQHHPLNIFHLVLENSLDCNMAKVILKKQEIIDKALDSNMCADIIDQVNGDVFKTLKESLLNIGRDVREIVVQEEAERIVKSMFSEENKRDIMSALAIVSGRCDGARHVDDTGFNKIDSSIGKSLANQKNLSDKQTGLAKTILRKYWRQIPEDLFKKIYPS